jgi:hypothetical protein
MARHAQDGLMARHAQDGLMARHAQEKKNVFFISHYVNKINFQCNFFDKKKSCESD